VSAIPSAVPAADLSQSLRPRVVADLPTRKLLEAVVECGYTGYPWDELACRLVSRALPDLEQAIRTGSIYQRCRRARLGIPQRQELQRRPLAQDIAAEAVEDCLERFKVQVLPRGEWDPDRGMPLEDFFAACCLPHVANRWRWHLHQLPPSAIELDALDAPGQAGVLALVADLASNPAVVVEARDLLTRTLASASPDDRVSFVLREQGWSQAEIARMLGIGRNALDARMSRARKAARARRTW
jgi:DNA-directed RNA polymerase specialized sigma24 family protein